MDQDSAFTAATAVFEWATNNVAKVGEDRSPIFLLGFSLGVLSPPTCPESSRNMYGIFIYL